MRILLAIDGSACSDRATELVSTFPCPPDSVVRVVAVHRPLADVLGLGWEPMGDASTNAETEDDADVRRLREAIARAESRHPAARACRSRASSSGAGPAAPSWTRPARSKRTSSSSAAGATGGSPP